MSRRLRNASTIPLRIRVSFSPVFLAISRTGAKVRRIDQRPDETRLLHGVAHGGFRQYDQLRGRVRAVPYARFVHLCVTAGGQFGMHCDADSSIRAAADSCRRSEHTTGGTRLTGGTLSTGGTTSGGTTSTTTSRPTGPIGSTTSTVATTATVATAAVCRWQRSWARRRAGSRWMTPSRALMQAAR